jgi:hypothetical protein
MLPSISLRRTGPYKQKETAGLFGMKGHNIPEVNPDDGSYMPKCAQGPCLQYSYSTNSQGQKTETCERYGEPTRVPEKTNLFDPHSDKDRTSCGFNSSPVGLFSSNAPTYYVYWKDKPIGGRRKSRRTHRRAQLKRRKSYRK